jgi:hypothetical protein
MKKLIIMLAIPFIIGSCKAQTLNYETVTVALTSINTALTALNASGITPTWQTQYTAGLAMATGAAQIAYGMYTDAQSDFGTLNIVNIAAGVATLVTNGILLYQTFHTGKTTSLNFYYSPLKKNTVGFGIRFVKTF